MALPRQQVVEGILGEIGAFEELVRSLDEREWATPTRCEGWTVGDVAGHLTGTVADVAYGRLDVFADPDFPDKQAAERRGRTPAEVADELRDAAKVAGDIAASFTDEVWNGPAPQGVSGTLGDGVEAIWYDAYVHADDIRAAIGRPAERGPGLRGSVAHVAGLLTERGWGPATLAFDGMEEFAVSGGGGRRISGDPLTFVLVATGRQDPSVLGLDESVNVYR